MTGKEEISVLNFLQDYQKWTRSGAPEDERFSREFGLCTNYRLWWNFHNSLYKDNHPKCHGLTSLGLFYNFKDGVFPFNSGGGYEIASAAKSHWLNKKRNKWVSNKIIAMKKSRGE